MAGSSHNEARYLLLTSCLEIKDMSGYGSEFQPITFLYDREYEVIKKTRPASNKTPDARMAYLVISSSYKKVTTSSFVFV